MIATDEYRRKELEFAEREDALCETVSPSGCDCRQCPCQDLCNWLCKNDPHREEL